MRSLPTAACPVALRRPIQLLCAVMLAASLGGCAAFISDPEERAEVIATNDPIEGVNRHLFAINLALDTFLLRPASVVYRELVPQPGKEMVKNFTDHLTLPFTAMNDLAQGETDRAETAMSRFLVNTVVGIGGLFDAATGLGLVYHEEDFGQTLAVWGSEEGPYLMLPLFGPSNLRDAIGLGVEFVADPIGIVTGELNADEFGYVTGGLNAVDSRHRNRESIDTLQEQSLDFYAAVRSLYRQRREAEIENRDTRTLPEGAGGMALESRGDDGDDVARATPPDAASAQAESGRPGKDPRTVPDTSLDRNSPEPEDDRIVTPSDGALDEQSDRVRPTAARQEASPATELAEAPRKEDGRDRFAEAARAFDRSVRAFDAIARSVAETK